MRPDNHATTAASGTAVDERKGPALWRQGAGKEHRDHEMQEQHYNQQQQQIEQMEVAAEDIELAEESLPPLPNHSSSSSCLVGSGSKGRDLLTGDRSTAGKEVRGNGNRGGGADISIDSPSTSRHQQELTHTLSVLFKYVGFKRALTYTIFMGGNLY